MSDLEIRLPQDELRVDYWPHIITYIMFATPNTWIKEFVVFANFYSEDLP